MLIALKHFLKEGNNQYAFKTIYLFDVTIIYVTLNVLLFNAVLLLYIGLPKYLIWGFVKLV